jgi:ribonuclease HI
MDCRETTQSRQPNGSKPRQRGNSATRAGNLSPEEVLARFTGGPQDGVFTDGSCQGNPGPGGWGAVYVRNGEIIEERTGYDPATTNNRMELTAMIQGLSMIRPEDAVDVYSDSSLVVDTLTKWAKGWEARGWKRKEGEVKNLDLVQEAYDLARARPLARIQWIRAHDGSRWNEYADALSTTHLRP